MAKSVYEILDICADAIDSANRNRYGLGVDELLEIAQHRDIKVAHGVGDAIIDAYHLGMARGMQCERNREARLRANKKN